MTVSTLEPWLDEEELCAHFKGAFKSRWLKYRRAEGLPHAIIAGKARYKASQVEPWLEVHGFIDQKGEAA